ADHRGHVGGHGFAGAGGELLRFFGRVVGPFGHGDPDRQVAQRVVGGGLVGDDVGFDAAAQQFGQDFGGVADDGHRVRAPLVLRGDRGEAGRVEVVGDVVGGA